MDMTQLSKRQLQILNLLQTHEYVTKEQLCVACGVHERSIRNDINELNQGQEPWIHYRKMKGYYLAKSINISQVPVPKPESNRLFFIIRSLIFHEDPIDIFDLAETLYVSEATIEKDLILIKQRYLRDSRLSIIRIEGKLYLEGEEKQKRSFLCDLLIRESSMNNFDPARFDHCFRYVKIQDVEQIIKKTLQQYQLEFSDAMYMNLLLHVAIAVERIMLYDKHTYDHEFIGYEKTELLAAKDIAYAMERQYGIQFSYQEQTYLALLLHGKQSIQQDTKGIDFQEITRSLIAYLASSYEIDFTNDLELQHDLSLHLQSMHARLCSDVGSHNVLMEEIKHAYPFMFEMGVDLATYYETVFHTRINQDEVGFIVLHLVCAFERYHHMKLQTIIVCPTGYSSSKILEIKLHNAFVDTLQIVKTCSLASFQKEEYHAYDFIISTVALPECKKEVFVCSPFLNGADLDRLDELIHRLLKKKQPSNLFSFFEEALFFKDLDVMRKEDVITFLGEKLHRLDYVNETYVASVLEREAFSTTAYKEGIAIPHPMNMNAKETRVAVAILKKPLQWERNKVQLVFLLALKAEDKRNLFELYECFARLSEQKQIYKQLLDTNSCASFLSILEEI